MLQDSDWNHIVAILAGAGALIFFGMFASLLKVWARSEKLYLVIASLILFAAFLAFLGWLTVQVLESTGILTEDY